MKPLLTFCILVSSLGLGSAQSLSKFTETADGFFQDHVRNGKVDYAAIKEHDETLTKLVAEIGSMPLSSATATEKKAFYINAYNLLVIHSIVEKYPVGSPMDISGFFDGQKHTVAGESLTLNELEKTKLLRVYEDARIHFAVVCAAKGCPPLASFAFQPSNLEAQLQERTRNALNDTYFIRYRQNRVEVSKIFEWYQSDFTKNGQSVLGYINQFRDGTIPTGSSVSHYEYDWALNKQ